MGVVGTPGQIKQGGGLLRCMKQPDIKIIVYLFADNRPAVEAFDLMVSVQTEILVHKHPSKPFHNFLFI